MHLLYDKQAAFSVSRFVWSKIRLQSCWARSYRLRETFVVDVRKMNVLRKVIEYLVPLSAAGSWIHTHTHTHTHTHACSVKFLSLNSVCNRVVTAEILTLIDWN